MSVSPTIGKSIRDDGSSSSATTPRVALALVVVVSSDGLVSYRWVAASGAKTAEKVQDNEDTQIQI